MKKVLILMILLFMQLAYLCAQEITAVEKQNMIEGLNSSNEYFRISALEQIGQYNVIEAEDALIEKIDSDLIRVQQYYIQALYEINSQYTEQNALDYLSRLDSASTAKNWSGFLSDAKAKTAGKST